MVDVITPAISLHFFVDLICLYPDLGPGSTFGMDMQSTGPADGSASVLAGITVDKSVEFSYEELATATDNFSLANKIGEGGFGSVYYAELRGEVCSIYIFINHRCHSN